MSQPLGLIENQPDGLRPGDRRTPAALLCGQQRSFDGKFVRFGGDFDRGYFLQVQPASVRGCSFRSLRNSSDYALTHDTYSPRHSGGCANSLRFFLTPELRNIEFGLDT